MVTLGGILISHGLLVGLGQISLFENYQSFLVVDEVFYNEFLDFFSMIWYNYVEHKIIFVLERV